MQTTTTSSVYIYSFVQEGGLSHTTLHTARFSTSAFDVRYLQVNYSLRSLSLPASPFSLSSRLSLYCFLENSTLDERSRVFSLPWFFYRVFTPNLRDDKYVDKLSWFLMYNHNAIYRYYSISVIVILKFSLKVDQYLLSTKIKIINYF